MPKFIFITGGVCSSLGKGIAASSIGRLIESRGLRVSIQKMDPYLNVDAGTMSPYQHGEVYVTEDGVETDLDLGTYARFTDSFTMGRMNTVTTGQIYQKVIEKERRGAYLGRTVEMIPHVTNEIQAHIQKLADHSNADIIIVEIGGTVGDIESIPFLEAIRQFARAVPREDILYTHMTLVPGLTNGELKTKPTQHSVHELQKMGISPDIILLRSKINVPDEQRQKLSLFCNVPEEGIFSARDCLSIYEVPLRYQEQSLDSYILTKFGIPYKESDIDAWKCMVSDILDPKKPELIIGILGKYVDLPDAYKSIHEALIHSTVHSGYQAKIIWLHAHIENANLDHLDGLIIPGGFGERGIEGKVAALHIARTKQIPTLGICLGMQCMIIEYARNVAKLDAASSTEFDPNSPHPVVSLLEEQKSISAVMGATMRLGAYQAHLKKGTAIHRIYKKDLISERHRHRYEVNTQYKENLETHGLIFSAQCSNRPLIEAVEDKHHPWYIGVQFHPEFNSKPLAPHPLFQSFIKACSKHKETKNQTTDQEKYDTK